MIILWYFLQLIWILFFPITFIIIRTTFISKWCSSILILCSLYWWIYLNFFVISYLYLLSKYFRRINTTYLDFAILIWMTGISFVILFPNALILLAQNVTLQSTLFIVTYLYFAGFRFITVKNFLYICYRFLILF